MAGNRNGKTSQANGVPEQIPTELNVAPAQTDRPPPGVPWNHSRVGQTGTWIKSTNNTRRAAPLRFAAFSTIRSA